MSKRTSTIAEYDPVFVLFNDGECSTGAILQVDEDLDQLVAIEMLEAQCRLVLLFDIRPQARGDAADIGTGIVRPGDGLEQLGHVSDQGVEKTMVVEIDIERADIR